jgi:hypothetical protein
VYVDEHTGYRWAYSMRNKDDMPKIIKQWMIDSYEKEDRFSSWSRRTDELQCEQKSALAYCFWAGRSVKENLRKWSLRH